MFERSIKLSTDDTGRTLSLAYKHFCQALAANSRFEDTLEPLEYETAVRELTVAAAEFSKARFDLQSIYASSVKLLLEAHMEMANATRPSNTESRPAQYDRIKSLLRESAEGFGRAHQSAKQSMVQRLIENLDQQLGIPKVKISRPTSGVAPLVVFPTSARGEERPVGYSRFVGTDIEARYVHETADTVKEGALPVEITVANSGSQPIRLLKVSGLVPGNTSLVKEGGDKRVQADTLILEPKLMAPETVETIRVDLRPESEGPVFVNPRIVFLDDMGRTVSRGLPLKVLVDSPILRFLTNEFLLDFQSKRLALSHCGWRTLPNIVDSLNIPRSHLYGEPRWGHAYGKQLDSLIRPGLVESRTFPGERGRGGRILKVRLAYENDIAKQYAELAAKSSKALSGSKFPLDVEKGDKPILRFSP